MNERNVSYFYFLRSGRSLPYSVLLDFSLFSCDSGSFNQLSPGSLFLTSDRPSRALLCTKGIFLSLFAFFPEEIKNGFSAFAHCTNHHGSKLIIRVSSFFCKKITWKRRTFRHQTLSFDMLCNLYLNCPWFKTSVFFLTHSYYFTDNSNQSFFLFYDELPLQSILYLRFFFMLNSRYF